MHMPADDHIKGLFGVGFIYPRQVGGLHRERVRPLGQTRVRLAARVARGALVWSEESDTSTVTS